jgi:peptidoglycan hydrolase-like protein with peptidoglycan-binding domain
MLRQASFLAASLAVVLMGWAAAASAQTASEPMKLPPLPPASQDGSSSSTDAPAAPQQPAETAADTGPIRNLPPLPLDHDGIREVQNQLIALGFDPGPADGETGPATLAAVQQYNESRGGTGRVPVDGRLLARLQQDTGPRLTPEQVAARAQPRYAAPPDPVAGMMQQFQSTLRAVLNGGY